MHTLPSVHDLKRAYPHLEITWVANSEWLPLLQDNPDLTATVAFPRGHFRGLTGALRAIPWFAGLRHRTHEPDVALDFQGLFRSGLMAGCSRSPMRIGLEDAREGAARFYHKTVPVPPNAHAVDRYRCLPAALGAATESEAVFALPKAPLPEEPLPDGFIALHPFSRGEGKSLSLAQVESFCRQVERPVVVLGRLDEHQASQLQLPASGVNLLNRTSIPELIACLRKAWAVISVDSGPMHLAAALQPERLLSVHTWSDPRKVGPYPLTAWVWKGGRVARRVDLPAELCQEAVMFGDDDVEALSSWVAGLVEPKSL